MNLLDLAKAASVMYGVIENHFVSYQPLTGEVRTRSLKTKHATLRVQRKAPTSKHKYLLFRLNKVMFRGHHIPWVLANPNWSAKDLNLEVDHLNGVKLDNRLCNLELVTKAVNMERKKAHQELYEYNRKKFKQFY